MLAFVCLSPSRTHSTGQIIFFYESPKGEVREKVEGKWEGFHGGLKVFFHIAIILHLNHFCYGNVPLPQLSQLTTVLRREQRFWGAKCRVHCGTPLLLQGGRTVGSQLQTCLVEEEEKEGKHNVGTYKERDPEGSPVFKGLHPHSESGAVSSTVGTSSSNASRMSVYPAAATLRARSASES